MTLPELIGLWRTRQAEYEASSAMVDGGLAVKRMLSELEAAISDGRNEVLTLCQASNVSGLTVEHLARQIRKGRIANSGRKGAPRIRRSELPMKGRSMASAATEGYDAYTDARFLTSRR